MSALDSLGQQFDGDDRSGGMFRSYEKSNVSALDMTSGYAEKEEEAVEDDHKVVVRPVILGVTFGHRLAQEIVASGENAHLINSTRGETQHVTKPLMQISDVPVVNVWASCLKGCDRIKPVEKSLVVVCNEDNHDEFESWRKDEHKCAFEGGLRADALWSNGVSDHMQTSPIADVARMVKERGYDSHLMIIDADYVAEPDFNLQRIVEHSLVRGKDCVTFVRKPRSDMTAFDCGGVDLGDAGACPSVSSIRPGVGPASGMPVLGPVLVLRKTTLPLLCAWVDEQEAAGTMPPHRVAMQHFLSWLTTQVPVYGLEMKHVFTVKSLDGFLFTDNLFEFIAKEKKKVADRLKVQDTDSNLEFGTRHAGSDVAKRRLHAQYEKEAERLGDMRRQAVAKAVNIDNMLPVFEVRYEGMLQTRLKGEVDRRMPERFTDASLFRNKNLSTQHACYTTTSNMYGCKQPTQQEMPMTWSGIKGDFTSGYRGLMFHNTGFVTNKTTSKVHKHLDDYF